MKKVLCVFMAFVILVLCGCTASELEQIEEVLGDYLAAVDGYESPVREAGTVASYIYMDEKLDIGIIYPETGVAFLDDAITSWVEDIANEYKNELKNVEDLEEPAELAIAYESYLVGDSFIGIKLQGTFFSSQMAHPADIVKTFNADVEKGIILDAENIPGDDTLRDKIVEIVVAEAKVDKADIDEDILDKFVLMKDGIEIILNRGDYLPMSDGTKTVKLKYEEIMPFFEFSVESEPESEEEAETMVEEVTEYVTEPVGEEVTEKAHIDPQKPMLALTFDDGPSAHTERLLDIFGKYGGKGTFFVLGNLIDGRKGTLKRIADEGHEIGNHGWNHRQMTKLTDDEVKDQIMMTRAKIYDVTGRDCLIVRPPYGSCNDAVKSVGRDSGVVFVNWSVDTLDWKTKNAQAVYDEIIGNASDGAIILCHDLHKTTVDAMEEVIPKLIEEGYQLVTVSELLSCSKNPPEAGKMYYKR